MQTVRYSFTSLYHEALDVSVEDDTIVVVAGTQRQEVFTCAGSLRAGDRVFAASETRSECGALAGLNTRQLHTATV